MKQPQRLNPLGHEAMVSAMEIANYLGVSIKHVRRMADKKQIPTPIRIGRIMRWRLADIEGWINSQLVKAAES